MRLASIVTPLLVAAAAMAASPVPTAGKPFAFGAVRFEENRGQTDASVRYLARARGQRVFFTNTGVVFASPGGAAVTMRFEGAGASRWKADGAAGDSISYYIGNDPAKWVKGAPVFDRVVWRNAYPGIDIAFRGDGERLEYDLLLAPGADASKVRVRFDRPASAHINADGTVEIAAAGNTIRQHAPEIWQEAGGGERRKVNGKFLADGANGLRLSLAAHERSKVVVVDPVLEFGSYYGGENDDEIVAIIDGVIAGNTRSVAFPGTLPALRTSRDVFVHGTGSVVPGQGNTPNTFGGTIIIGGSGDDQIAGIAASPFQPGFYLAGTTSSTDFPMAGGLIPGGSQTYHGGASDGFIGFIQLYSQSFASLGFSNYIGGSGADRINAFTGNGELFAYAGVTDSPDLPTFNASQASLAGGKDAFYGVYSSSLSSAATYGYLGGSGDDSAYAVALQGTTGSVWIGGSSASSDFPFVNGALSGPSDGFLAVIAGSPNLYSVAPQVTVTAYRVGGSGDDAIRALVAAPYSAPYNDAGSYIYNTVTVTGIGFAGTTTSPDLPVLNAAQPQFGGASDGFVGIWNSASAAPRWMTYAGGSGADQFNAIAQNWAGDLYVGGSTSSTDLPVVNALQPANGGGQDAMFAVYDYTGALQQLTYFGGSGDDNIEGMWMDDNYIARMVGSTSSTDLPEYGASQGPGGGLDGFIANIGSDYLVGPTSLIMPKDGLMTFSVRAARTAFRQPVTYQSADPSRVRLVYLGQSFNQVTAAAEDNIGVEALADNGEADITVASPGFSTKTIHVNLYPGAFATSFSTSTATLSTWSQPVNLYYSYCAIDPASGAILGVCMGVRSGAPAPVVYWTSSDATVAQIGSSTGNPTLQPVAPGTVTLTFSVDGYNVIQSSQTVTVAAPAPFPPANGVALGKDLTASIPTTFFVNGVPVSTGYHGTFTARSGDPSRLLLATDGTTPGRDQVSVTMQYGPPTIYAQALTDNGTVQVFFSSDQFPGEIALNVNLEPALLRWGVSSTTGSGYASSISLTVGLQSPTLQYSLQGVSGGAGAPRPGATPLTLTLSNTNPTVVELNRLTVVVGSTNSYTLRPLAAGSTTLTLTGSNPGIPVTPASLPVNVQPSTVTASLPSIAAYVNVGNGLQSPVSFGYSAGASTQTITVSVDDPSVATVSSSAATPGTNQLTLQAGLANLNYTIYVQGHGSSGTTSLHVQFPQGTQTIPVKLFPSGAGFSVPFRNSSVQGYSLEAQVAAYYLDPNTGIGIVAQTPGPGPGIMVDFSADGPVQFYHSSAVLTAANPNANVDITAPPAGRQVDVTVTTEGGASVSPITASLKAGTLPPSGPVILAQLTLAQGEFRQYTLNSVPLPATVTSSDPQNVLVSASATDAGSPSIQLPAAASSIYIHALGSAGLYTVEFDSPTAAVPTLIQVALVPLQLSVYSYNPVLVGASTNFQTSLNATALAPGVGPFHFTAQTSDPTVATVTPTAFDLGGNSANPGQLTVTGVSAGTAQLTVTGPSGVYVNPPSFPVTVGAPAPAATPTYTLGVNLQGTAQIDLGANFANANGAIVTLTSSDPTILSLSRSATTVGAASVVIAVPAGTHVTQAIYLQALAQGTVTIQVTAGAPAAVAANVVVQPSWVSCGSKPISLAAGASQTLYCFGYYAASAAGQTTGAQFQSVGPRAGLSNLTIGLASSAPNVFTVTPATQTLAATSTGATLGGIAAGTGILQVTAPPGFGPSPDGSEAVPVTVAPATFGLACGAEIVLGQDTQITCMIGGSPGAVTATSTDPSLLLVSANANTAGAATASSGGVLSFTIQALANAGTAEIVFSASGYQDARIAVALRPSQFTVTLPSYGQQALTVQSGNSLALSVAMLQGGATATPRAGVTIPLDLSVDNSNIASLTPAHLNFTGAQGSGNFTMKALAPGSTLLRVSAPANYQVTGTPVAISVTP